MTNNCIDHKDPNMVLCGPDQKHFSFCSTLHWELSNSTWKL